MITKCVSPWCNHIGWLDIKKHHWCPTATKKEVLRACHESVHKAMLRNMIIVRRQCAVYFACIISMIMQHHFSTSTVSDCSVYWTVHSRLPAERVWLRVLIRPVPCQWLVRHAALSSHFPQWRGGGWNSGGSALPQPATAAVSAPRHQRQQPPAIRGGVGHYAQHPQRSQLALTRGRGRGRVALIHPAVGGRGHKFDAGGQQYPEHLPPRADQPWQVPFALHRPALCLRGIQRPGSCRHSVRHHADTLPELWEGEGGGETGGEGRGGWRSAERQMWRVCDAPAQTLLSGQQRQQLGLQRPPAAPAPRGAPQGLQLFRPAHGVTPAAAGAGRGWGLLLSVGAMQQTQERSGAQGGAASAAAQA